MQFDNRITIILPTYNNMSTIEACLDEISKQTLISNVDLRIHDDASTDCTVDLIQRHPIKKLCNSFEIIERENNYYQKHRNWLFLHKLILTSGNNIVFFAEADDMWVDKFKLQRQCEDLFTSDTWFSWHHYKLISEESYESRSGVNNAITSARKLSQWDIIFGGGGTIRYSSYALNLDKAPKELLEMCFRMEVIDLFLQFVCSSVGEEKLIPCDTTGISLVRAKGSWTSYSKNRYNQLSFRQRLIESILREQNLLRPLVGFKSFIYKYIVENLKLCIKYPRNSISLFKPTYKACVLLFSK